MLYKVSLFLVSKIDYLPRKNAQIKLISNRTTYCLTMIFRRYFYSLFVIYFDGMSDGYHWHHCLCFVLMFSPFLLRKWAICLLPKAIFHQICFSHYLRNLTSTLLSVKLSHLQPE